MKNYRVVDKKEPRFRVSKYRYMPINKEFFEDFKKDNPNIRMDFITFREIIIAINEEYVNFVIENRDGVFLPKGLGRLYLGLYPRKERRKLDHSDGKVEQVFQAFETGGFEGKIMWCWDNVKYKTDNVNYFSFIGYRNFKTRASQAFINNPELYIRDVKRVKKEEYLKRKENARTQINSPICDKPSEDGEQGSECGFEVDQ